MKNFLIAFIILIGLLVSHACAKYENGPSVSLLSSKKRLIGTHSLEKIIAGEKEIKPEDLGIKEDIYTFYKNGTGKISTKMLAEPNATIIIFEWEFDDKKEKLRIRKKNEDETWGSFSVYTILRLTKNELWLVMPYTKENAEYHYKKN
ncbi:hypothetical protein LJC11_02470 [Bacteroidales bacterium OttesenSCG-928-I21]|nr:hypothetical protein [Bacteroidales bacterium OttesenSCG-928-I21]